MRDTIFARSSGSVMWGSARSRSATASRNAVAALRLGGALEDDRDGLLEPARPQQVVGDLDRRGGLVGGQHVGRPRVDHLATRGHDLVVDRLLGQGVAPAVAALAVGLLLDQLQPDRGGKRRLDDLRAGLGDGDEGGVGEGASEDGRHLEDLGMLRVEAGEALDDGVAHRLRNPDLVERRAVDLGTRLEAAPRLGQHLLEEERVALGAFVEQVDQLGLDEVDFGDRGEHLGDPRLRQRIELEHVRQVRASPVAQRRARTGGGGAARRCDTSPARGRAYRPAASRCDRAARGTSRPPSARPRPRAAGRRPRTRPRSGRRSPRTAAASRARGRSRRPGPGRRRTAGRAGRARVPTGPAVR